MAEAAAAVAPTDAELAARVRGAAAALDGSRGCHAAWGHGACVQGDCVCSLGWQGAACEEDTCPGTLPPPLAGVGDVVAGGAAGGAEGGAAGGAAGGVAGGVAGAARSCSGRGQCVLGVCHCADGWEGPGCEEDTCPNHCTACVGDGAGRRCYTRGTCVSGSCACHAGWRGADCSHSVCDGVDCSGARGARRLPLATTLPPLSLLLCHFSPLLSPLHPCTPPPLHLVEATTLALGA